MRLRLVRQAIDYAKVQGYIRYIPVRDVYYILQVSHDEGEHWETVPVVQWDHLSQSDRDAIIREIT